MKEAQEKCEESGLVQLLGEGLLRGAALPGEEKALRRAEMAAERCGLRLTPQAYAHLGEARRQALRETRRLEVGTGILPTLMLAFCDSPYVEPRDWEETLAELQGLFYHWKNETGDTVPDDALTAAMARLFHQKGGSLKSLAMTEREEIIRAVREVRHG